MAIASPYRSLGSAIASPYRSLGSAIANPYLSLGLAIVSGDTVHLTWQLPVHTVGTGKESSYQRRTGPTFSKLVRNSLPLHVFGQTFLL